LAAQELPGTSPSLRSHTEVEGDDGKKGTISVSAHREGGAVRVVIQDNGIGLPETFNAACGNSMGLKLAQSLAHQLGGTLQFTSTRGCRVDAMLKRL
jgi:two-component sensor histidine kinase